MSIPASRVVATVLLLSVVRHLHAAEWKDLSPHTVRFVEPEPGVRLEVLDWGGKGPTVLLLAGHGDSAHVFDDFAPALTNHYHVLALTRRGFGASSKPDHGYTLARMVQDIDAVVESLHLGRVHLVGHSIAGDEMVRFALTYPGKVGKLVYLEAAYDRVEAQRLELKFPKLRGNPPSAEDGRSPRAMGDFVARTEIRMPESEIRASRVFDEKGRFLRSQTPDWIAGAVAKMVEHPNYSAIQNRQLAIYAIFDTPAQFSPRFATADPATKQTLQSIYELWHEFAARQRQAFQQAVPAAHVVEIHGANHYIFLSHSRQVLRAVDDFLQEKQRE